MIKQTTRFLFFIVHTQYEKVVQCVLFTPQGVTAGHVGTPVSLEVKTRRDSSIYRLHSFSWTMTNSLVIERLRLQNNLFSFTFAEIIAKIQKTIALSGTLSLCETENMPLSHKSPWV